MKKNAFTLIELLSVIVILAIIALIATPIVVNIINDSKENSLKRSIDLYMNSVKTSVTKESMNPNFPKGEITCTILNEKSEGTQYDKNDLICIEDNNENISSYVKIDIKGETPINGEIKMNNGRIIEDKTWLEVSNNTFYKYESNIIKKLTEDEINNLTPRLPKEYQEVEYIESTGTQYIDTGYNINSNKCRYKTKINFTNISETRGVFGVRNSMTTTSCIFVLNNVLRLDWVSNSPSPRIYININSDYDIEITRGHAIINDNVYTSNNNDDIDYNFSFYIGNFNQAGSPYQNGMMGKIYYGELYFEDSIVRNFVPCYSKTTVIDVDGVEQPEGTVGMYDLVEGKFYTNQGTGEFIKGPDVN